MREREGGARAERRSQAQLAAERVDGDALHDVHAHAASAALVGGVARGEAGPGDQREQLRGRPRAAGAPALRATRARVDAAPSSLTLSSSWLPARSRQRTVTTPTSGLPSAQALVAGSRWRDRRRCGPGARAPGRARSATALSSSARRRRRAKLDLLRAGVARHAAHEQRHPLEQLRPPSTMRARVIAPRRRAAGGGARCRTSLELAHVDAALAQRAHGALEPEARDRPAPTSFSSASSSRLTLDADGAVLYAPRCCRASSSTSWQRRPSSGAAPVRRSIGTSAVAGSVDRRGQRVGRRPRREHQQGEREAARAPASLFGTDCGTTFTISASWREPLAHARDREPAAAAARARARSRAGRPAGPALRPCTSCSRSGGASFSASSSRQREAALRPRVGRPGRRRSAPRRAREQLLRRSRDRLALGEREHPLPRSRARRGTAARPPRRCSGARALVGSRSSVSISCAISTIGSTPTIADRPLMVCSARNSSRTMRSCGSPG